MATNSTFFLVVFGWSYRCLRSRFFRQIQLYLVCGCVGLFHAHSLWNRDFSKNEKRTGEEAGTGCRRACRSRIGHAVDHFSAASEAKHPGALRPSLEDLVALRIWNCWRGHRLLVV